MGRYSKTIMVQDGHGPVLALTLESGMLTVEVINKLLGQATVDFDAFKAVLAELDLPE